MLALILVLLLFGLILMVFTYLNRRNKPDEEIVEIQPDEECCGAHAVCDRDSLLNSGDEIEYFDDEELDSLSHISPDKLTSEQIQLLSDVFYTLNEKDIAAWLRSLQLRSIQLPVDLRDQALLIVSERRSF